MSIQIKEEEEKVKIPVLEVKRIVKEATNGGLMEKVETELRMIRKERESVRMILMEEEAQFKENEEG